VLTKRTLIDRFDDLVTDRKITRRRIEDFLSRSSDPRELFYDQYHVVHTSGTSGAVALFVFSHDDWIVGASQIARALPPRLRQRTAFLGATRGHFTAVSLMLAGNHGANRVFHNVRTYDVSQPLADIIEGLNRFQPHRLAGYGSVIHMLAEAQQRGTLHIRPRHIGNGGEMLPGQSKQYIESVFDAKMQNVYASSEHLYMGMNLDGDDGLHLLEDDLIYELHDDHVCVTNLFNRTLPLIRYRMDDVLVPNEAASVAVGRRRAWPYRRVRNIVGRRENALTLANRRGEDDFIHGNIIVEFYVPGLAAWQAVALDKTSFLFRVRYQAGLTAEQKQRAERAIHQRWRALLAEKHLDNVQFRVEEVPTLGPDPRTGKFRLVVPADDTEQRKVA
jgi:phenylacetate-coenzyme A ligase PaaK-like adenylate-forming protein